MARSPIVNTRSVAVGIIVTLAILEISLDTEVVKPTSSRFKLPKYAHPDLKLAQRESLGFFSDIKSSDWVGLKKRVKDKRINASTRSSIEFAGNPQKYYSENHDADFTCLHEQRIGGKEWVCDPHRIQKNNCLVYSFVGDGDFMFEMGILMQFPECEVHVFDPTDNMFAKRLPEHMEGKIIPHVWGLANAETVAGGGGGKFKTFQDIVRELGHQGRSVDIFKIDCELCEWVTYRDWFETDIFLRQIIVEVHRVTKDTDNFFRRIQREGYVLFHKKANTVGCIGDCVEFSFLKLGASFFI